MSALSSKALDAYVARLVDAAPPLSPAQRQRIREAFHPEEAAAAAIHAASISDAALPKRYHQSAQRKQVSPSLALAVFGADDYRCCECGGRYDLTIDHIVSVLKGGTNDRANLRTLCRPCNSKKGAQ